MCFTLGTLFFHALFTIDGISTVVMPTGRQCQIVQKEGSKEFRYSTGNGE